MMHEFPGKSFEALLEFQKKKNTGKSNIKKKPLQLSYPLAPFVPREEVGVAKLKLRKGDTCDREQGNEKKGRRGEVAVIKDMLTLKMRERRKKRRTMTRRRAKSRDAEKNGKKQKGRGQRDKGIDIVLRVQECEEECVVCACGQCVKKKKKSDPCHRAAPDKCGKRRCGNSGRRVKRKGG
jgi:hypothetical protein